MDLTTPPPTANETHQSSLLTTPEVHTHTSTHSSRQLFPVGYHWKDVMVDPEQPQYMSWASLETGVPTTPPETSPHDEQQHMSLITVDIQSPSTPTAEAERSQSTARGDKYYPKPQEGAATPSHRLPSSPYSGTPTHPEYLFEPRVPESHGRDYPTSPQHFPTARSEKTSPVFAAVDTHAVTASYLVNSLQASSPVPKPRKGKIAVAVPYEQTKDDVSGSSKVSADIIDDHKPQEAPPVLRPNTDGRMTVMQPGRSLSKDQEDEAYTKALLMHQRARYERLCKELKEEQNKLDGMREQTVAMERDIAEKRHHRSPFPTPEEISKLREQKHQLQIDIECMNREIESHKSQGLMDIAQSNNFYGNIGSTGAPGPVPPFHEGNSGIVSESIIQQPTIPVPDEGHMWSCSACTLLNHPALDKCECCEMPRDK